MSISHREAAGLLSSGLDSYTAAAYGVSSDIARPPGEDELTIHIFIDFLYIEED